jgi:hypothetical protein
MLLTVASRSRHRLFDHAVRAMGLAGALAIDAGGCHADIELALLGGLLHDLGEMYVEPAYLVGEERLDGQALVELASHPHVGELLIAKLTDYPTALARAIGEHHERLDGTGYPAGPAAPRQGELGRLLAVTEAVMGVVDAPAPAPLSRARLAIGVVPAEFDQRWTTMLGAAARTEADELDALPRVSATEMQARLRCMDRDLQAAQDEAEDLCFETAHPALSHVADCVSRRLAALRTAWNESGLWALDERYDPADGGGDVELMERELHHRMKSAWRHCALRGVTLNSVEQALLEPIQGALCGPTENNDGDLHARAD